MQFDQVQFRAVAFVLAEAILGETCAEVPHYRITGNLGNDTGGGDAEAVAIAINNRGLWQWEGVDGKAVDQHMVGLGT